MDPGFIQRGGLWVATQAILLAGVVLGGALWAGQWESRFTAMVGLLLLALGAAIGLTGALSLGRNLTPLPSPGAGAGLVQSGIYAWVRHPLYDAVFCAALGWTLLQASWPALVFTLLLVPFLVAKARTEETFLRARFPEYADYQKQVKGFVPGVY
jgi:protein-S-isoprenylcysteine O-methyltransferase Ste14